MRTEPICTGTNHKGELTWATVPMEMWKILQLYRRQYQGDFGDQWMWFVVYQKQGIGWGDS